MGTGPTPRKEEGKSIDMSGKTARKDRKKDMKIMSGTANPKDTANEQAVSIRHMIEERDKKAANAKEHLISQLEVTVDKYRTGNGVMSALNMVRTVLGEQAEEITLEEEIGHAKGLAIIMASKTAEMAEKAKSLDPDNMDSLCENFYKTDFAESEASALDLMEELLILQLCQNVGPDAEDIVEFCKHADEEIEKARENLKKFCEENKLDFLEVCGEK